MCQHQDHKTQKAIIKIWQRDKTSRYIIIVILILLAVYVGYIVGVYQATQTCRAIMEGVNPVCFLS